MELNWIYELFSTRRTINVSDISFTLVKPIQLRDYTFDVSTSTETLLDIKDEKDLMVFNIVVIQNPLDESKINFQAPLIFNKANGTVAQEVLGIQKYPAFGFDESLKTFTKA